MKVITEFGYCEYSFEKDDEDDYYHIYNLYIYPQYRNMGKATQLLRQVICAIKNTGYMKKIKIVASPFESSVSLNRLIKFYKKMGLDVYTYYG